MAFKVEDNVEHWCELWVSRGYYATPGDPATFVQVARIEDGQLASYFKIENGFHPMRPGVALSKCDGAGHLHMLEPGLSCPDGDGVLEPYDGFSRLEATSTTTGASLYAAILDGLYAFLTTEQVPDPENPSELCLLLDRV